ncbi:hypothetical protein HanRHA438_Chr17g0817871 [Helianthus annuus]|nr:hypothetical protein HanRHA438_Chr17g0817871 [Helianthus annuus]
MFEDRVVITTRVTRMCSNIKTQLVRFSCLITEIFFFLKCSVCFSHIETN